MSRTSPAAPTKARLATVKVTRMLTIAPEPDLLALELIRRRLVTQEAERQRTWPSPRRTELGGLVASDIETLCRAFVKLERAAERRGTT